MGIVNVTPDSFYDGGRYRKPEQAVAHALELLEQGADILDVGAESTRPGSRAVPAQDEIDRVIPVVSQLARRVSVPISVDTRKSAVARRALDSGASIINDVSALRFDEEMGEVIAQSGAAVVLMHMQGTPETMQREPFYGDVVLEVNQFFAERIEAALGAGIDRNQIVLDPGIGFGKLLTHNLDILNRLSAFAMLQRPLLVGLSRKGFIGQVVHRPVEDRQWGTAAAVALAVDRGAHMLRVHDVGVMKDVVTLASAVAGRRAATEEEHHA